LLNANWSCGGTQFIYSLSQIISNLDENLTLTKGKHQILFGGCYRHECFGDQPDERQDCTMQLSNQASISDMSQPPTVLVGLLTTSGQSP
jgi:hypothetical protein